MAYLLAVVLAISTVPVSSNVIKGRDARHASLFASGNARLQARDMPDVSVVPMPSAPPNTLLDQIEESISTGSEQAHLQPRDQATVTIPIDGVKTLAQQDQTTLPPPTITAVRNREAAATPPTLNELVDSVSGKEPVLDSSPRSPQNGTKHQHLASTSIKTYAALAQASDTAANAEPSALPTSPPKGANVPAPPVLANAGEHTLEPLEGRAVTSKTLISPAIELAAVTSTIPLPISIPTLVTIHLTTRGLEITEVLALVPTPTSKPILSMVYASQGATGIPITAQRQVYTTYNTLTTCEYSPNTTVPFIATATPPPLQATCQTHMSPVVTSYCSTSVPQLAASNITVTDCNQHITYATTNGYSIISANSTTVFGTGATGHAPRFAPAIQTLTTYSAAVWDAITPGSTPTAGERVVCTQGGGCRTTSFFMGAVVTNGSSATHPRYTMANSTGTPSYTLSNPTATARHFTVPAPSARGTGSFTVPPFPTYTASGASPARQAGLTNSTATTHAYTVPVPSARGTGAYAIPPFPTGTGTGSSPARAAGVTSSPAPTFQWLGTGTTTPTGTSSPATTSSVIDIGF